jgi:hypothetical protein
MSGVARISAVYASAVAGVSSLVAFTMQDTRVHSRIIEN